MKLIVAATDEQWEELNIADPKTGWQRVEDCGDFAQDDDAAAYLNLKDDRILPHFASLGKPVLINSVIKTLQALNAPPNILRINGWAGFLQREVWEVAGILDKTMEAIFQNLGVKLKPVADEPGLIAARIIAMIINEAYFTVSDDVSSREEIDTAMKLGTNYPYGPFEWAARIGPGNILHLLEELSQADKRYQPAELLIKEIRRNNL